MTQPNQPFIPDFTATGESDQRLKPTCTNMKLARKGSSPTVLWTIDLVYKLDENITRIILPPAFAKYRDDILRAVAKEGGRRKSFTDDPLADVEMVIHSAVGGVTLALQEAPVPVRVKRLELMARPKVCRFKVVLIVALPESVSNAMVGLLTSDVWVKITTTGSLFPDAEAGQEDEDEDEDGDDDDGGETDTGSTETGNTDLPPEPEQRSAGARIRRRARDLNPGQA